MTEQQAPAGWYDDPAGGGGRRFWDGSAWTMRVEGKRPATTSRAVSQSRDRIPDGYMLLNGRQVPIRGSLPHEQRSATRGLVVAGLVMAALVVLLIALGA